MSTMNTVELKDPYTIIVKFGGEQFEVTSTKAGSLSKENVEKMKSLFEEKVGDSNFQKLIRDSANHAITHIACKVQIQETEKKCALTFYHQDASGKEKAKETYTHTWTETAKGVKKVATTTLPSNPLKVTVTKPATLTTPTTPTSPTSSASSVSSTGLANVGNTCWMNSSLQALHASGVLKQLIDRFDLGPKNIWKPPYDRDDYRKYIALVNNDQNNNAYTALKVIYNELEKSQDKRDDTQLTKALRDLSQAVCKAKQWSGERWVSGQQQDSEEFVTLLMESLNYKPVSTKSIIRFKDGAPAKVEETLPVTTPTFRLSNTADHPDPLIANKSYNIQSLFDYNFSSLPSPSKNEESIKNQLTLAPDVLTLQVNNFTLRGEKIKNSDLEPDKNGNFKINAAAAFNNNPSSVPYHVNSFIVHVGGRMEAGHYVSFSRKGDKWYYASDDEEVREASIDEVKQKLSEAYLIFLKKGK